MKNRNIQFKATAGVLIPLLLACFAAVFISAPTPAAARDMVPFNGTLSGYVETLESGTECDYSHTRDHLRTREPIGSLHRDGRIFSEPLRARPIFAKIVTPTLAPFTGLRPTATKSTALSRGT